MTDSAMTQIRNRITLGAAAIGGGALIALGALAVATGGPAPAPASASGGMRLGPTVTSTTPTTSPATPSASPIDKAHPAPSKS